MTDYRWSVAKRALGIAGDPGSDPEGRHLNEPCDVITWGPAGSPATDFILSISGHQVVPVPARIPDDGRQIPGKDITGLDELQSRGRNESEILLAAVV